MSDAVPMMLSANLSVAGFCATQHRGVPNLLPDPLLPNARRAADLWEHIVDELGPCILTSGYRSPELNRLVGGSFRPPSAHMAARALDFIPQKVSIPTAMAALKVRMAEGLPVDKLLLESCGRRVWVHAQVAADGNTPRKLAMMTFDGVHFAPFESTDRRVLALA